jgi:hypothetical protein
LTPSFQIHLPGQHLILFDPSEPRDTVAERAAREVTTLTQFFKANTLEGEEGNVARELTYQEFPQKFVWNKKKKEWTIRQRGLSVGRMYFIPPTAGELFYARTLLTIFRGPKSFIDLRTYEGVVYACFKDACSARGLLADDGEWRLCLQDASQMQTGSYLRHLFASMLLFCQLSSPETIWSEFQIHICDDLHRHIANPTADRVYDYGLFLLNRILSDSGYSLQNFPHMPLCTENWVAINANSFIADQLGFNAEEQNDLFLQNFANVQQVPEQLHAFNSILYAVDNDEHAMFFLNGAGGTGKTYLYRTLCHKLRSQGKIVLCVASSGIAALLLPGGRTAHSTFRIPIDSLTNDSYCNISKQDRRAELLRATHLIIWDEALMQSRFTHQALDRTMRDLCDNDDVPFGGKTIVFGGDFQQTLPVIPGGTPEDVIFHSLPRSHLWHSMRVLNLQINMRLLNSSLSESARNEESSFANWLLSVGHGEAIASDGSIAFDPRMQVSSVDELIDNVYPNLANAVPPPHYFLDRIVLAPRNTDVNNLNDDVLRKLPGEEVVLYSADYVDNEPGADAYQDPLPLELLRSLEPPGFPSGELHLKRGCPLILLRNLAPGRGLCNGTRLIFRRATHRVLEVEILSGTHSGQVAFIPRIALHSTAPPGFHFQFNRRQFPVRLAFSITINKAQGQSVRHVGLDLREPVFSHGQLYVALSRATSSQRIKVLLPPDSDRARVANVVYQEIFQSC